MDELPSLYGIDVAEALRDYFSKYFCASNMGLVIQAAKTLDTLEKWVDFDKTLCHRFRVAALQSC